MKLESLKHIIDRLLNENGSDGFLFNEFHEWHEIVEFLNNEMSDKATLESIGSTHENRQIYSVSIGDSTLPTVRC